MKIRRITNDRCFLIGKTKKEDLPWNRFPSVGFASGREAIVALIRSLDLKEGDVVLLPSFVPEGIIAPCRLLKLKIVFYRLDRNLDTDWDFLENLAKNNHPELAILIHFFGVPRNGNLFGSICHRYNALVLEDFAHMQILPERNTRTSFDFALYSLRKIIGIPDGAVLQMNTINLSTLKPKFSADPRRMIYILMNTGELFFNTISRRLGSPHFWNYFWKLFGRFFSSYRFLMWYYINPSPISGFSKLLMNKFPWRATVVKRVGYEHLYSKMLDRKVFKHLCSPEEGHCSMGYAVLVENRKSLNETLALHGISGLWFEYKWDHFPEGKNHEDAKWTMKNHFLFPTAYSLSEEEIIRVIQIANEWAKTQID